MNYNHKFHAGNFADVIKHSVITQTLPLITESQPNYCIVDTHAGFGQYELNSNELNRTQEHHLGVYHFLRSAPKGPLLQSYLAFIEPFVQDPFFPLYPGSPLLLNHCKRAQDTLWLNELHPATYKSLKALFIQDKSVQVTQLNAYENLLTHLQPHQPYCFIIDPAFEAPSEVQWLANCIEQFKQLNQPIQLLLWYPIKSKSPFSPKGGIHSLFQKKGYVDMQLHIQLPKEQHKHGGLEGCGLYYTFFNNNSLEKNPQKLYNKWSSLYKELDVIFNFIPSSHYIQLG